MTPDLQPAGGHVFAGAVQWLQATLLGTVATAVAVIAIASVGLLLMSGRIDLRRGAQVIFGCFILFGASSIAGGIVRAVSGTREATSPELPPPAPPPNLRGEVPKAQPTAPYDPYAGAAMPVLP